MISRTIKTIAAAGLMAGSLLAIAPHAFASTRAPAAGDTDDNISPAAHAVTAKATSFTSTGSIDGISITVKCTNVTFTGKTPAKGLGPVPVKASIGGCSANGVSATVTTAGTWTLTFVDAANDEAKDSTADHLKLTVPKDGATFSSSLLPGCKVIVAPAGPATELSSYNDAGKASETNDPLPVQGSGCSASSPAHVTSTLVLSPIIKDVG